MAINKFQWLRLTYGLSAKVSPIGVPSIYKTVFLKKHTKPIELKFHVEAQLGKGVKVT